LADTTPIWLDTDIGDDIDDAYALTYALAHPGLRLRGVSTVFEAPRERARLAMKLLRLAGRGDVPVYAGSADALQARREPLGWLRHQASLLDADDPGPPVEDAAEALAHELRTSAAPVTVVCIGPLTNIARLLETHPESARCAAEYVIMGGAMDGVTAEWNIQLDPEAAQRVFSSGLRCRVVPFDVTRQAAMPDETLARVRNAATPYAEALWRMTDAWMQAFERERPILYDPVTLCCLGLPEAYRFQSCRMTVRLEEGPARGCLETAEDADVPVSVCAKVDYALFWDHFSQYISNAVLRDAFATAGPFPGAGGAEPQPPDKGAP
jgi:purine nucleosidase/pyrimidine-specific ribonucleoside hydrolase